MSLVLFFLNPRSREIQALLIDFLMTEFSWRQGLGGNTTHKAKQQGTVYLPGGNG